MKINLIKKTMKQLIALVLTGMFLITACSKTGEVEPSIDSETPAESLESGEEESEENTGISTEDTIQVDVEYSSKDLDAAIDASSAARITFSEEGILAEGAEVAGSIVRITSSGTYILSGISTQGQIVVDAPEDADIILALEGLELTNPDGPAINIIEADKVILTLMEGTKNIISDGEVYIDSDDTSSPDAAIYSKADLTINGLGELEVMGSYNHGIVSKDDLKIVSGQITVTAVNDGIKGKDLVAVKDGQILINAGGDGIQSSNDEDPLKGFIVIENGLFTITAAEDGIQGETSLTIIDGKFDIKTGGGIDSTEMNSNTGKLGDHTEEDSSDSAKGLKAGTQLTINGGEIHIDAYDDAIHSNGSITINNGNIGLSSGDDAIHADQDLLISDGEIYIETSIEGLEGATVTILDGNLHVGAMDDGINTSGGNDSGTTEVVPGKGGIDASDGSKLIIKGGEIFIEAQGDGIDSNGDIEMSGGRVIIFGPTGGADGAVDYNGTFTMTSGVILGLGSSAMAKSISSTSTQGAFLLNTSTSSGEGILHIQSSDGEELITALAEKSFSSILFSSPDLEVGETYTVYTGGTYEGEGQEGVLEGGTYIEGEILGSVEMTSLQTMIGSQGMGQGGGAGVRPGGNAEVVPGGERPGKRP